MPDLCTFLAHKNRSFLYFLYTEYRGFIISLLHGNPSKCVCHRAEQNDRCKDWAKIFDHKIEDFLSFKGSFTENNFVFYLLQSDHSGDQKTCSNCCDRHHHGVSQEVKEIKELHSDDLTQASGPYPREERLPRTSMIAPTTSVDFCLHHFNSS